MTVRHSRTYLYIVIFSIALVIVLFIQVIWMLQTARIKEELFNEKARIVLSKTVESLSADQQVCGSIESGGQTEAIHKIDSLFGYYMSLYNIKIDYTYELKPDYVLASGHEGVASQLLPTQQRCYKQSVSGLNNMELKLIFPDKVQYIVAEMGPTFISSVFLIVIVLFLSWQTIFSLIREKHIAEQTTDFISNMTHELKTPLTNIGLAGKMLLRENTIGQENKIRHYSSIILEENEKLGHQVEQVLGISALERGELPLQKRVTDLHGVIESAVKNISLTMESRKAEPVLELLAEKTTVFGDQMHLQHVISNLLDNAIKYSTEVPEVTISTHNHHHSIVLSVIDKGIGIEKKFHKRIFDKFFRVPTGNIHTVKGFGVGLAYVKTIVDLHGGTIEVISEKNKGTQFIVSLPNG